MTKIKMFALLALGLLGALLFACTPSYPTHTPNSSIVTHGATSQYSFFSYAQIQYPTNIGDAKINHADNGGNAGDSFADTGGETGFVFDF